MRSLRNKLHHIETLLTENKNIIDLTETWNYTNEIELLILNIPLFNAIYKFRDDRRGGGIAVKKHPHFNESTDKLKF